MSKETQHLLVLEEFVTVEYFIEPNSIGGQSEDGRHETIPPTVHLLAVKLPTYRNGKQTEICLNIIDTLHPDTIQGICDEILEQEGQNDN